MERKVLKDKARKTLKKHYWLIVIACLFAAFLGAEYGTSLIAVHTDTTSTSSAQTVSTSDDGYYANTSDALSMLVEVATGHEDLAREQVANNQHEIADHDTVAMLGRSRGVLSSVLNSFSSGSFVLSVADTTLSVIHSQNIAIGALIVIAMLAATLFMLFVVQVYRVVLRRIMLEARTYDNVPLRRFFYPLKSNRWAHMTWVMTVTNVYLLLWWCTAIGGIIKTYSYFMVPYIVAENPNITAREAIGLSRRMMNGHKWECFVAQVSFFGWFLLNGITFGLSGIFYSNGYQAAFFAEYYVRLRSMAKASNIEGAQQLCDEYLYTKPSLELVSHTYEDMARYVATTHSTDSTVTKPSGFTGWLANWFGITFKQNNQVDAWQQHQADLDNIEKAEDILQGRTYPGRLAPAAMEFKLAKRTNLNPLRSYTVLNLVMMFFIFCVVGWLWEVTLALISEGMFVNRGTLHGPWLPIYGTGGIIILILLKKLRDKPVLLFVGTVVLCGCLEYFSSWYLELTHDGQRWWDYTGYFLNLNGRICAEGLLTFGLGGIAIVYLLAPALDNLLARANRRIMAVVAIVLLMAYIGDNIYSSKVPNTGAGITDYKESSSIEQ